MKKVLSVILAAGLLVTAAGCSLSQNNAEYTVNFSYNYFTFDEVPARQTVKYGQKAERPADPVRVGYTFLGWFTDEDLNNAWDFDSDKVTARTTLYAGWISSDIRGEISYPSNDRDFSSLRTPGQQEAAYEYNTFFLPEKDGIAQPYVGDTMPYYENGTYYIYYLKDGGDSYNHSIYLATTRDFISYEERQEVVIESDRGSAQDAWIGTGSLVKVGSKYYFFYTGHNGSEGREFKETVMVAEGNSPTSFQKKAGWQILPPDSLGQKNDFRDPQAYYDAQKDEITLTITASQGGTARVLKYTMKGDLSNPEYGGIIFTNSVGNFWNLECSDTFRIGNKWYLTYSAQDDTLFYAVSDAQYGPYSAPKRLEGKLFYAAKHVSNGTDTYMVGWARRSESVSSTQDVAGWAGNMVAQKVLQKSDGSIYLAPIAYEELFATRRALLTQSTVLRVDSGSRYSYTDAFLCYERFLLEGDFTFTGTGEFGFAFDYNGTESKYKTVYFSPTDKAMGLAFNKGSTKITEMRVDLQAGQEYSFAYVQEGSVGILYLNGQAALTVRLYGCTGKNVKLFASNNNVRFSSLRLYT